MNTHLRSDNISLQFNDDLFVSDYSVVNQLWQMFRRTAVEPGQSSSPDFASFSDEDGCLLCAKIVKNVPEPDATAGEHRDSLFDTDVGMQGPAPSSSSTPATDSNTTRTLGLIYLHTGPASHQAGEANIGVIIQPGVQRRGHAREAVQLVLRWAFEDLKFHRVQAAILDTPTKDRAMRLFIGFGFAHEGTKRRAVFQPGGEGMTGIWKDVTYLAMLDTEWMLKSTWMRDNRAPDPPVVSVWDEIFARHGREREELVGWEEKHGRIKRTASTETMRERSRNVAQDIAYLTDDACSSVSESSPPSPRLNVVVSFDDDTYMADDSDLDGPPLQRWEQVIMTSLAARQQRQWTGNTSLHPSMQGQMLALPSIPSTRLSEGNPQSPVTIPSPSTPGASPPPFSPSPSPAPSSVHSTWPDTEDDCLPTEEYTPTQAPIPFTTPRDTYPPAGPSSSRTRSRSSSVSSTDSWSDAQSSIDSSSWDVVSDASDHSSSGRG